MAPPMNLPAARVVDQINTRVARGYKNGMHVHNVLFPEVESATRAGKIIAFRAEHFQRMSLERAMDEDRPEVEFGYGGESYELTERAVDGRLPVQRLEEAREVAGVDLAAATVMGVMDLVSHQVEIAAADLATTPGSYATDHAVALSGNDQWSNPLSKPRQKIDEFRGKISQGIGRNPDLIVAGYDVTQALKRHPDVIDQVKHTEGLRSDGEPLVNDGKLASYFNVSRYVTAESMEGVPGAFKYVWGDNVVMAYSIPESLANKGSPSFGYTYRLRGYPIVSPAWYRKKRDAWIYPMTTYSTPVIAGKSAGILLQTVISR